MPSDIGGVDEYRQTQVAAIKPQLLRQLRWGMFFNPRYDAQMVQNGRIDLHDLNFTPQAGSSDNDGTGDWPTPGTLGSTHTTWTWDKGYKNAFKVKTRDQFDAVLPMFDSGVQRYQRHAREYIDDDLKAVASTAFAAVGAGQRESAAFHATEATNNKNLYDAVRAVVGDVADAYANSVLGENGRSTVLGMERAQWDQLDAHLQTIPNLRTVFRTAAEGGIDLARYPTYQGQLAGADIVLLPDVPQRTIGGKANNRILVFVGDEALFYAMDTPRVYAYGPGDYTGDEDIFLWRAAYRWTSLAYDNRFLYEIVQPVS